MLALLGVLSALAAPHWSEAPPLTAPPEQIRAAASAEVLALVHKPDEPEPDVHILLDELTVEVADDGTWKEVRRTVFEPLTAEAATAWGTWHTPWDTWRESRPRLEARVMQADGDVYTLDSALVAEAAAGQDPLLLTDSKKLQAPLPQIEAHAIVEQVMTIDRVEPMLAGQFFLSAYLERQSPIERVVVHIEAPKAMKLHTALVEVPAELDKKKKGERQTLDLLLTDVRPVPARPSAAPVGTPRYRTLYVSSAPDWATVSKAYADLVASQLDPAGLEAMVAPLKGKSRDAILSGALDAVVSRVRYTGVLFGQNRIVPNPPSATLQRGFGDCKDQATFLVSLLRAAGVPASLALLHASSPEDVPEDVPMVAGFDHAIVYVPGDDPRWIDPTEPYESSMFTPAALQGHKALVIGPDTTGLTPIPYTKASQSVWRETLTYTLPYRGKGSAVEDVEATGMISANNRTIYRLLGDDERAALQQRAENVLGSKVVRAAEVTPSPAIQAAWRSHVEAEELSTAYSYLTGALVSPWAFHGAIYLPSEVLSPPPPVAEGEAPPERFPLEFTPYVYEMTLKVRFPEELDPQLVPQQDTWEAGTVRIQREVTKAPGELTIHVLLDAGTGKLSVEDTDKLAEIFKKLEVWPSNGISFNHSIWNKYTDGHGGEALQQMRATVEAHPDDAVRRADLVRMYMAAGLVDVARREFAPIRKEDLAEVRFVEAALDARDPYGRYLRGGFDRDEAIRGARKALALDPDHDEARNLLIDLLERNDEGAWLGDGSDPCGAAEALEVYVVDRGDNSRGEEFIKVALRCPEHEALDKWLETVSGTPITSARVVLDTQKKGVDATVRAMAQSGQLRTEWAGVAAAMFQLADLGRFDDALALASASKGWLSADEQQRMVRVVDYLKQLQGAATRPADPSTAEGALLTLFRASGTGRREAFEPSLAQGYSTPEEHEQLVHYFSLRGENSSPRMLATTLIGMSTFKPEGDAKTGYRVAWRMESGTSQMQGQLYLIPVKGKLLVLTEAGELAPVARYAAMLAKKGEAATAMTWLGWAAEGYGQTSARAPLERQAWLHLLRLADPARPATVELAALALECEREPTAALVDRITALRAELTEPERQVQIDRVLMGAYASLDEPAQVLPVVDRLLAAFPDEPSLVLSRLGALAFVNPDEAERGLKALDPLRTDPSRMTSVAASVAMARGNYTEAADLMKVLGDRGVKYGQNNSLWFALFTETLPTDLSERVGRFAKDLGETDVSSQHTVAAVKAATGDLLGASALLQTALDQGWALPGDLDIWSMVRELIAEQAGERELAITAYKASPSRPSQADDLARRRLEVLGAKR